METQKEYIERLTYLQESFPSSFSNNISLTSKLEEMIEIVDFLAELERKKGYSLLQFLELKIKVLSKKMETSKDEALPFYLQKLKTECQKIETFYESILFDLRKISSEPFERKSEGWVELLKFNHENDFGYFLNKKYPQKPFYFGDTEWDYDDEINYSKMVPLLEKNKIDFRYNSFFQD